LLVLRRTLTSFGNLRKGIDKISSLRGTLTIEW
jgi:hypothetical protein